MKPHSRRKEPGLNLLSGLRVIENGLLLNGGTLGMYLADLGAEVIKIEDASAGDYLRNIMGQINPGRSPAHLQVNKNKRSLAVNLKSDAGLAVLYELVKGCDVYIDGLRPGVADKLQVGYADLKARNERIIYVQYTGYGAKGPYATVPTHGYQMTALAGGLPTKIGDDGLLHLARGTQYMGGAEESSAASALGAQAAAIATLSALFRRSVSGEGAYIDVAASDAVMSTAWMGLVYNLNYDRITDFQSLGERTGKHEAKWPEGSTRYQVYRSSDGKAMLLGAIEPKFWKSFCEVSNRPDLVDTMVPGFAVDYGSDKPWLRAEIQRIFESKTCAEWMELAVRFGIPIGPAPSLEELPTDPHVSSRGVLQESSLGSDGMFTFVGFPAHIDGKVSTPRYPAPEHGEHTVDILRELGMDEPVIEEGLRSGDFYQHSESSKS